MIKLHCLGGFREVGANSVLVQTDKERILMEHGLRVETGEMPIAPKRIDHFFLAHPHLDHAGSAPALYRKQRFPSYATAATYDQAHLLFKDSIKIARLKGFRQNYDYNDIRKMKRNEKIVTFGQSFDTRSATVGVHDAGHVPGSCFFVLDIGRKRFVYTSDFNSNPTRLLNGAKISEMKGTDVLIMESTYSSRDHPPRKESEDMMINTIRETIANNGIAVIPVFAVGRAAEVLSILQSAKPDFPIYLDGMAREATEIALRYPELLRNPKALQEIMDYTTELYTDEERAAAIKKPCAIVTTGGVIEGGPAVYYIKRLYSRPECSLIFTGYQIPRTAGRYLMDTGRFVTKGFDLKVKMNMKHLDFSAHAGRTDLLDLVKKVSPEKVICMHGDNCERFATELRGRFEVDAVAPENGDVIKID